MNKKKQLVSKRTGSELLWDIVRTVFIFAFTLLCVYPFYYVIIYSISDPTEALKGVYLFPRGFTLETYRQLFAKADFLHAFFISGARTVVGTLISLLATSFFAFMMTRQNMFARKFAYRFVIVTMYVGGGMIPWYLTMKAYHLDNTFLLYVLPGAVSAYNMILIKTFIEQLPESLLEAATIDGASLGTLYWKIVLPLSKPILATVSVFNAVGQWNSWTDNFFLVHDKNLLTLQLLLNNYLNGADSIAKAMRQGGLHSLQNLQNIKSAITPAAVRMTSIVITVIPIMLVYPFVQKYFTKGIMMGAVKG